MKLKGLQGYLLFAILGGFVAWVIWGQPSIEVDVRAYELKIEMLEQKIDSIRIQNSALKIEADSLETKIASYDAVIEKLNSKIYVIKNETKQKVDAVDLFGDDELERFFADRYRQHSDTIN